MMFSYGDLVRNRNDCFYQIRKLQQLGILPEVSEWRASTDFSSSFGKNFKK